MGSLACRDCVALQEAGLPPLALLALFALCPGGGLQLLAPFALLHQPQEAGYNGVFINNARDCWARDIATTDADSGALVYGAAAAGGAGVCVRQLPLRLRRRRCSLLPCAPAAPLR